MTLPKAVLAHTTEGVTLGVVDKNLAFHHDLQAITFEDIFGAIHTVYSHKEGPFQAVEDVLKAFQDGTLHTFPDHDQAIAFSEQRGDKATAERLRALAHPDQSTDEQKTGG